MVKKLISAKKKKKPMEIVSDTSLSADLGGPSVFKKMRRKKKSSSSGRHSKRNKYVDKGKAVEVEYEPEIDSDFEVDDTSKHMKREHRSSNKKLQKGKKRIVKVKSHHLKRSRKYYSSDEDEIEIPKRGRKLHDETPAVNVKEWEILNSGVIFFGAKIECFNSQATIDQIKHTLTDGQLMLLNASCFGKVVQLENFKFQHQIFHNMLFREVSQSRQDEFWVHINGKIMRFGLDEFAIITGLKCVGSLSMANVEHVPGGLYDRYFSPYSSITKKIVQILFLTRKFDTDEDAAKLAALHLLVNFLMGGPDTLVVDRRYIDLIDSDSFNHYPWGKAVYRYTVEHMKGQCVGKEKSAEYNQKIHKFRFIVYKLRGFILSLQYWFYEVFQNANGIVCHPVRQSSIPRMLKWKCIGEQHNNKDIKYNFLNLPTDNFSNITPTDEERAELELGELFKEPNQMIHLDAIPSSSSDHIRRDFNNRMQEFCDSQKLISSDLQNLKAMFLDFTTEFATTVKSIQSLILGIGNGNNVVQADKNSGHSQENASEKNVSVDNAFDEFDALNLSTHDLDELERSATKEIEKRKQTVVTKQTDVGLRQSTRSKEPNHVTNDDERPSFDAISAGLDDIIPNASKQPAVPVVIPQPAVPVVVPQPAVPVVVPQQVLQSKPHIEPYKKRAGSCPLDKNYWTSADMPLARKFDAWLNNGLLIKPRPTPDGFQYYKARYGDINPPFDFNVSKICSKNWFMRLDTPGVDLEDTHVDVVFYYLRKLAMYSDEGVNSKYTTTDVFFDKCINNLYMVHQKSPHLNTKQNLATSPIVDYIHGYGMMCATSWFDVDQILFPIYMKLSKAQAGHWLLGRLEIKDRTFWVYNARYFDEADVVTAVKPYTTMLPILLELLGYYKSRPDIILRPGNREEKNTGAFEVMIADNLPTPGIGDSGLHMATFAEYFITDDHPDPSGLDVVTHRKRLACLLWKHGMVKQDPGYTSTEIAIEKFPEHLRRIIAS